MKKLMFVLAVVLAASMVQAASINWSTGTAVKGVASGTDSSFGASNAASGTLGIYVWLVDAATYNSTAVDSIWGTYGSKLNTATASATGKSGSTGATAKADNLTFSTTENTPYYGLVIVGLDTDKDGNLDYYIANKAESNINTAGAGANVSNLAKNMGGTGGTAITGWTAATTSDPVAPAVPEPTSGLLMLVGLGALALRRRA